MWLTKRRFIVASTAALASGTVAAAAAIRKPGPTIHTPVVEPVALQTGGGLTLSNPAQPVLPFGFFDSAGKQHLIRQFAGLGLVVNFWATWCPPCVAELPSLAKLAGMPGSEGIAVLAVSVDKGGMPKVTSYLRDHGVTTLDPLIDPHSTASQALGIDGLPTTLIIDRAGRERARFVGGADWTSAELVRQVRHLTS